VQERQNLMFCPAPYVWQGGIAPQLSGLLPLRWLQSR